MKKILFVCLGNICRSPLAEGLFKKKLEENGLGGYIIVDSAGTSNYHSGELPDPRTRQNAEQNGLILNSRARQFRMDDFQKFDLILAMDQSNLRNIKELESSLIENSAKLMLMRDFDPLAKGADVPDPYQGGIQGFQKVYDILDRSTDNLLSFLQERNKG